MLLMQDSKDSTWRDIQDAEGTGDPVLTGTDESVPKAEPEVQDGWQQYRRWISKAPAPRSRRNGLDPSLYTWKGYRNWTEQVKRNWSDS